MTDYRELKCLAEEAFGWDWSSDGAAVFAFAGENEQIAHCYEGLGDSSVTAAFIAKADPSTILALIAENEALRKDAERYRWVRNKAGRSFLIRMNEEFIRGDSAMDLAIDIELSKEIKS